METGEKTAGNQLPEAEVFFEKAAFWKEIDEEVLDLAYSEAQRKLESQLDAYRHISKVSSVLLGWMVGGIISLSAAIVLLFPGGWNTALIVAVYTLAALIAPSAVIVFGIQFGQSNFDPGVQPKGFLFNAMCLYLLDQDKGTQARALKSAALREMQGRIDRNREWNNRRIDRYHLAVWILIAELSCGVILFAVLSSVL